MIRGRKPIKKFAPGELIPLKAPRHLGLSPDESKKFTSISDVLRTEGLAGCADVFLVGTLSRLLVVAERLSAEIRKVPSLIGPNGKVIPPVESLRSVSSACQSLMISCLLAPKSRAVTRLNLNLQRKTNAEEDRDELMRLLDGE